MITKMVDRTNKSMVKQVHLLFISIKLEILEFQLQCL